MRINCGVVFACFLASVAQAQFLVPDQQYRCPPSDGVCKSTHKPSAFEVGLSDHNHHPYTINYVEYTDKGTLWAPQELMDAVNQVTTVVNDHSEHPLIVLYVHGWQNNASDSSGDVVKFRGFMSRLADDYPVSPSGKQPQVVGVYLAWRGLTFTVEPFKHIVSYWPRRQVAKDVGRTGIYDGINQIGTAVNADQEGRKNTFFILAGHSFGARVLENAIDGLDRNKKPRGMLSTYFDSIHHAALQARDHKSALSEKELHALPNMPADLVVYVNAATSSAKSIQRSREIRDDCREMQGHPICNADPFYIAFTSTNDLATGLIMPIANLVFPDLVSDKLHLISAANTPWLHTHRAPEVGCPPGSLCFEIAGTSGPPAQYYLPRITEKIQVPSIGSDAFWIFNVHSNLVNGHGDVWNPNVENMIAAILKNNGHFAAVRQAAALAVSP
jgi:hypothetical protein